MGVSLPKTIKCISGELTGFKLANMFYALMSGQVFVFLEDIEKFRKFMAQVVMAY